jgi:hypothetical protein
MRSWPPARCHLPRRPGRHRAPAAAATLPDPGHGPTKDRIWIPETARQGWLIITRDSRIQDHRAEIEAVRSSSARMIALASEEARNTWLQLEIVMSQWRAIERKLDEPGPFIYAASRTVLRPVDLK